MASTPSAGPAAASRLEPQTQAFLDGLARWGGPPISTLSPADARNVYRSAQNVDVPKPPADIEDRSVPGGPGGDVSVRVFRPTGRVAPGGRGR